MLVTCPDCERQVSDRAPACPGCGFPIAEHMRAAALANERTADRGSRAHAGIVDCVRCEARGFYTEKNAVGDEYSWCRVCEHTGRVALCRSDRGWFAVARRVVDAFVASEMDDGGEEIVFLGAAAPPAHRYPTAGPRVVQDDE